MSDLEKTLLARGQKYGDYEGGVKLRTNIMTLITNRYEQIHKFPMHSIHESLIFDIVNKLSRLAVTPNHVDSWRDISGYAELTKEIFSNATK